MIRSRAPATDVAAVAAVARVAAVTKVGAVAKVAVVATVLSVAGVGLLAGCSAPGGAAGAQSARPPLHSFDTYNTFDWDTEVEISFTGFPEESGPCRGDYRAQASETVERVYVQVQSLRLPDEHALALCQRRLGPRTVWVSLSSPLNGRAVVDAATGQLVQGATG